MPLVNNRRSITSVIAVLLLACLGWLVLSGQAYVQYATMFSPSRSGQRLSILSFTNSTAEVPSVSVPDPSLCGTTVFDATMLTNDLERHVERLTRLETTIAGLRDFLTQRLKNAPAHSPTAEVIVKAIEYIRVVREDIAAIKRTDRAWQTGQKKMLELRNFVWNTFERLQNPADCKSARKLRCSVNNEWGFGSGVQDLLWCFVAALQMGRTLILDTSKWHYTPSGNWSTFFEPVAGPSCDGVHIDKETIIFNPGHRSRTETRRRILDLPASIVRTLVANHAEPYSWWYGLIVSYILRLRNSTWQKIENFKKKIGYKRPIVSVHIRRTDKDAEAAHHNVSEYMHHAEEFYSALALRGDTIEKRVFVATDEPSVIDEIKFRFPSFVIIANKQASTEASWSETRYGIKALENIIIDVNLLAESDSLVCSFSSGFCRVAYQLMQARHAKSGADATRKAVSIDIEYFYAFVSFPPRRALYENSVVNANEMNWTHTGVLLERMHDLIPLHEAKEKKYADGFSAILTEGPRKANKLMVFPRFKTLQTYSVACYVAFNDTKKDIFYS